MKNIWNFIADKLSENQLIYLMVNTRSHGSSPGKQGFKMAVAEDGSLHGSIGGGMMEHNLVSKARKLLAEKNTYTFLIEQDHNPKPGKEHSGMICSGKQSIMFFPLNKKQLPSVREIEVSIEENKPGVLRISREEFRFNKGEMLSTETQTQEQWAYTEQLGLPNRLFIFGAGHVGLALSQLFSTLDFQITVFDNRKGLNTFEDNHFADVKKIVDFKNIESLIPEGGNIYVAVMTFAHKNDEMIVRQLASKDIQYLGMMGSEMKVKTIFDNLKSEGVSQKLLDRIDAPIGLEIGSETPAEIAVSIAAKIISVRRSLT
jgi:xanthine dehydrogenase accessory factor